MSCCSPWWGGGGLLPLRGCVGILVLLRFDREADGCFGEGDAVRDVEENVAVLPLPEGCRSVDPDCVALGVFGRD